MSQYRLITQRLRIQMPPGRPHIETERPRHKSGRYLDLDDTGQSTTLVDIPDDALCDVAGLLALGAIQELPQPPTTVREPAPKGRKGAASGEDGG